MYNIHVDFYHKQIVLLVFETKKNAFYLFVFDHGHETRIQFWRLTTSEEDSNLSLTYNKYFFLSLRYEYEENYFLLFVMKLPSVLSSRFLVGPASCFFFKSLSFELPKWTQYFFTSCIHLKNKNKCNII